MLRLTDEQFAELRRRPAPQTYAEALAEGKAHQRAMMRPKYRNKKERVGDKVFDSKLEARRYVALKTLEEAGAISALKCQVPFAIEINGVLVCKYIADFCYTDGTGRHVVEDVKGMPTREYKLKKKLMHAVLGIEVAEYRKGDHARRA